MAGTGTSAATHAPAAPGAGGAGVLPARFSTDAEARKIVDLAIDTSADVAARHGLGPRERHLGGDVLLVRGGTHYNRVLDDIMINPDQSKGDPVDLFRMAAHEHGHRIMDKEIVGFPGVLYVGQSGSIAEATAQTNAALTLAATGDPKLIAAARETLDTAGKTERVGEIVKRDVPYPQHMRDYDLMVTDTGGVHVNRSIPMRALLHVADERGWDELGTLFYDTLINGGVDRHTRFSQFRDASLRSAARLEPRLPGITAAVQDGWRAVGLLAPRV